jgi:hypothetical protein
VREDAGLEGGRVGNASHAAVVRGRMATNINDYGQTVCSVNRRGEFNTLVVLTPVPD